MLKVLSLIGCLISFSAAAEIHQWTDKDGVTHFSDQDKDHQPDYTPKMINGLLHYPQKPPAATMEAPQYIPPTPRSKRTGAVVGTGGDNCTTSENAKAGLLYSGDEARQERIWKNCRGMR